MGRGLLLLGLSLGGLQAQVPYTRTPQWESLPQGLYATGGALVDLTGDTLPEFVVACGNDMERQPVLVYRNQGGVLEQSPSWSSSDRGYHGHLAVADVDGDGWFDVAVCEYLGEGGFGSSGGIKLYRNLKGELERLPSWRASERFATFRCAWGDMDGDGRPDLAVAGGEAYQGSPEPVRVYRNVDGRLSPVATWRSADSSYAYDIAWEDFNGDGWLDIVVACSRGRSRIYFNRHGVLETQPGWLAAQVEYANSLATGDVDGDGWVDVVFSFNRQLGGSGRYALFRNRGGELETSPSWYSAFSGYSSDIALVDLDGDGGLDLVAGAWWDTVRIYRNLSGAFTPEPDWRSGTRSVVEAFAFADVNADGRYSVEWELVRIGNGSLVRLPIRPVEHLEVWVGDRKLQPSQYTADYTAGWISLPREFGDTVKVRAWCSHRLDMAVTNWDPEQGDFLFLRQGPSQVAEAQASLPVVQVEGWEGGSVRVQYFCPESGWVAMQWIDMVGRVIPAYSALVAAGWRQFHLPLPLTVGFCGLRVCTSQGDIWIPFLCLPAVGQKWR